MSSQQDNVTLLVGVVALQGAFREHVQHVERLNDYAGAGSSTSLSPLPRVEARLVRSPRDLEGCAALILPGGESTAIALGAQRSGLLEPLRDWVRQGQPVWGTCAGMILLSREASGIKKGGQELLGGIDIRVGRNGFGSQVDSFEQPLHIAALTGSIADSSPFPGVFIRAPIVESLLLPDDLAAVAPQEVTMVGRGRGEKHEQFAVQRQDRIASVNCDATTAAFSDAAPTFKLAHRPSAVGRATTDVTGSATELTISVAPPLELVGEQRRSRPAIEILATLPDLPRGAPPSASGGGHTHKRTVTQLDGLTGDRPEHDSMIVALKQGRLMCTSFHPELTSDPRLHEYFLRRCVLQQHA